MKRLLFVIGALALSASAFAQSNLILERGAGRDTYIYAFSLSNCLSNKMELAHGLGILFSQHGIKSNVWRSDFSTVTDQLTLQVEVTCTRLDNGQVDFAHVDFEMGVETSDRG